MPGLKDRSPWRGANPHRPSGLVVAMETIYLDHAATTPLRPEARQAWLRTAQERPGNPSSVHRLGREARAALEDSRARVAAVLGCQPAEVVFTRGGTEADNLAILGRARHRPDAPVVAAATEHRAVLGAARRAEAEGSPLHLLPVDAEGRVELGELEALLDREPAVVAVAWANNETGTVQPVARIGALCRARGVAFHTDAVQAFGKLPVRVGELPVELLALSAHKLGGPRGMGALFVRNGTGMEPLLHGGGQERRLRPGTEDVAGAAAFAVAAELAAAEQESFARHTSALRDRLQEVLLRDLPDLRVNAGGAERLPNLLNVSIPGTDPEALLISLDLEGIAVSSGSACSSGAVDPSHVLTAMGLGREVAGPSLRFSLGMSTTVREIEHVGRALPRLVARLREMAGAP